jgi:hypothetical protein
MFIWQFVLVHFLFGWLFIKYVFSLSWKQAFMFAFVVETILQLIAQVM